MIFISFCYHYLIIVFWSISKILQENYSEKF